MNFGYFPSDGRSYSAAELFADARSAHAVAARRVVARRAICAGARDTPLIPAGAPLGQRLA